MTTAPTNQCNVYEVQSGDTLSEIAEWFHVKQKDLQRINHIKNPDLIYPGDNLTLSEDHNVCMVYTVQPDDNLTKICRDHGLNPDTDPLTLARYNHIKNPNLIHPGEKICIPQS